MYEFQLLISRHKNLIFSGEDSMYEFQLLISQHKIWFFGCGGPKDDLEIFISASSKYAAWLNKKRVYLVIITCGNRSWRTARTRFKIEIKWSKSDILHHWAVHLMIFQKPKNFQSWAFDQKWPNLVKNGQKLPKFAKIEIFTRWNIIIWRPCKNH